MKMNKKKLCAAVLATVLSFSVAAGLNEIVLFI